MNNTLTTDLISENELKAAYNASKKCPGHIEALKAVANAAGEKYYKVGFNDGYAEGVTTADNHSVPLTPKGVLEAGDNMAAVLRKLKEIPLHLLTLQDLAIAEEFARRWDVAKGQGDEL